MKKLLFCVMISLICCAGCGNSVSVSMSEQTEVYFYGEQDDMKASVSVGKREEPYILDGIHCDVVDFSLVVIETDKPIVDSFNIVLSVNGKEFDVVLELNPLNMTYMADAGLKILGEDRVVIQVDNMTMQLNNISKDFVVGSRDAIQIATDKIVDKNIDMGKSEAYLKLLNGNKFGGQGLYWYFTLLSENGESENILIDTMNKNDVFCG